MRKSVILSFLFVLMFSCIFWFFPGTALADNEGKVIRKPDSNRTFDSVRFTVSSNAHSTGTVYRTTGLKIGIGPYNAFFDQAYLTSKGFYSSSSSNTVDFTVGNIAERSGATVEQIRAAANDISNGFNLGAQIKVLQNGVVKATIEEKAQVAPVFNQYGLGSCIASAESRWGEAGEASDPYKPITLTMQIEGQGSTTPAGSPAPGTIYPNKTGNVELTASPIGGWKFAYWYDVVTGNSLATTTTTTVTMNRNQTIKAVFIPDSAIPPAVTPSPPEPPAPEPPPPPPAPPNYNPFADFDISNPTPVEGQTVQLRDDSTHPGAANGESIVSWQWTIEKGNPANSTERNVNVSWDEVGTYKITLRVEDQDGDSDRCTKSVVVGPALPAAVITLSSDSITLGREVHIDGDQSTAAMGRSIKWDEMDWKIYGPDGSLKRDYTGRYPLGKGTANEKTLTNSVLNQTGTWTIKLKVKDTNDNESEQVTSLLTIYPDQPPIADFWLVSETLRNSYQGYELAVHDQSRPAAPDGTLGDEIFQRTWTLYYDANNNGVFTVAGADSATLTTTSANDQYPKIRFYKTGRYKLELTVRERVVVWGVLTNGLSGDTSGKALEEKQVVVINLAPTVAFEIQKKMPVDVQFAADYTVSDSKYNSLQSAQAGVIAALEAGGVDPVTGVQKLNSNLVQTLATEELYSPRRTHAMYIIPGTNIGIREDTQHPRYVCGVGLNTGVVTSLGPVWSERFATKRFEWSSQSFGNIIPVKRSNGMYILYSLYQWQITGVFLANPNSGEVININAEYNSVVSSHCPAGYQMWIQTVGIDGNTIVVYERPRPDNYVTDLKVISLNANFSKIQESQFTVPGAFAKGYEEEFYTVCLAKDNPTVILVSGKSHWGGEDIKWGLSTYGLVPYVSYEPINLYNSRHPLTKAENSWPTQDGFTVVGQEVRWQNKPLFAVASKNHIHHPVDGHPYYYDHSDKYTHPWHLNPNGVAGVKLNKDNSPVTADIRFYSWDGTLLWQKSAVDYGLIACYSGYSDEYTMWTYPFIAEDVFGHDTMVLYGRDVDGNTPCIVLVDSLTGKKLQKIMGRYMGSSKDSVVVAPSTTVNPFGSYNPTPLLIYKRTQMGPLRDFVAAYPWDSNKENFVAVVSDANSFEDYSTAKSPLISHLNAHHANIVAISPATGQTKTQANELIRGSEGGWWIQTAATMPGPLAELAQKIIALVNLERGADNIVLVNQKVELSGNYSDPETDPVSTMRWEFSHDPYKLGSYSICNSMGISYLNGAQLSVPPTCFDKVGTFLVRYRAKDNPVTNATYINDPKAGAKWSSMDAYLTVLVHRKPIAAFTLSSTTINKTDNLVITDNSYDPDLVNTDPEGKKGLRNWEWQYRNTTTGEEWKSSAVVPSSFTTKGTYAIRLRVRDAHGAWSDWTDQKLFTVLNNKPIAAFEALPNPVFVNNPCSLIDSSYDPDGDPLASWEWTIQGIGTLNKVSAAPFPVIWPNVGDYLVTLRVRDNDGIWSDPVSQTVKVINYFMLTLESVSIQNGRGTATATPGGNPPGPSGSNRVDAPVFPVNITSNEIGAYSLNQQVTLTAEPVTSGTYFVEWREGDEVISRNATLTTRMGAQWLETVNNNTTCTISMTGNRTITAVFMKDPDFIPAVPPKTHVYIVK